MSRQSVLTPIVVGLVLMAAHAILLLWWSTSIPNSSHLHLSLWRLIGSAILLTFLNVLSIFVLLETTFQAEEKATAAAVLLCYLEFLLCYFPLFLFFPAGVENAMALLFIVDAAFVVISTIYLCRLRGWIFSNFLVTIALCVILFSMEVRYLLSIAGSNDSEHYLEWVPISVAVAIFARFAIVKASRPSWLLIFAAWTIIDLLDH